MINVDRILAKYRNKARRNVRRAANRLTDEARRGLTIDRDGVPSVPGEFPTTQSTELMNSAANEDTSEGNHIEFTVSLEASYAQTLSDKERLLLGTMAGDMQNELERLISGE